MKNTDKYFKFENKINKFIAPAIIFVAIALTAFLLPNGCNRIDPPNKPDYNTQKVIDSVNNVWRNGVIVSLQRNIDSLKSVAANSKNISAPLKKTIKYQQFQIDSMKKANVECPVILAKATETIDTMNVVIEQLGVEAESYSNALYNCEKQRAVDELILNDSKALSRQCDSLLIEEYKNTSNAKKQTKSAIFWGNVKAVGVAVLGVAALIGLK